MFTIRTTITFADIPELKQLYRSTVLTINRKDYTADEVEDWASCGEDNQHWLELINTLHFIVAENDEGEAVGFVSISDEGYLHSLFVHKDYQRQGVATLLYKTAEELAQHRQIVKITSEVSITARPFFEKQGFTVDEKQRRKANNLLLTNYKMSKVLPYTHHSC